MNSLKEQEQIETPIYLVITLNSSNKEEVLPVNKVRLIRRRDDKATIVCENKYYFPKESYNEIKDMIGGYNDIRTANTK